MNNLIIRTEQLDGKFVTKESLQKVVEQLSFASEYHFNVLKEYCERNGLKDEQRRALMGSNLNLSLTHRLQGYFGPKTVHCATQLMTEKDKASALRYYCNAHNYEIKDYNGNMLDGMSPWKGPCLVFLVKFMEEIIGFKNTPKGIFNIALNGGKLTKAMKKAAPIVGFNNNFQPEEYMRATTNKSEYMRSLTIVQKIVALQWMMMGNYAFREDLLPMADQKALLKKKKKEQKPKKPRKLKKKKTRGIDLVPDALEDKIGIGNTISQDDFRKQPLFQQIQYLYEMVGGSLAGRNNQKLSPYGRVSRADFMAATVNQQTMWLYRQLQGQDEDGDEDNGLRKHIGGNYKIGGSYLKIKNLKTLSQGRVTHQTRYLGKRALKHETKIQNLERNNKKFDLEITKLQAAVKYLKAKLLANDDDYKKLQDKINKGGNTGGIGSKLNVINMAIGYALDASILTVASTGLAYAIQAKNRLDEHDYKFKKIYKFLTDDLFYRFEFIWNEFSHINRDVTLVHLEAARAKNHIKVLQTITGEGQAAIEALQEETKVHAERIESLTENQNDIMVFRNRVEMLMIIVVQFFEQNGISFTDPIGGIIDMSGIRTELESAYNYLRELIEAQDREVRAVGQLAFARIDELERKLTEVRTAAQADRRVLEDRIAVQDTLIQRLSERLDAFDGGNSTNLDALTSRVESLESTVGTYVSTTEYLRELAYDINSRLSSLNEYARRKLQNHSDLIDANRTAVSDLHARIGDLATRIEDFKASAQAALNKIPDLDRSIGQNRDRISSLNVSVSNLQDSLSYTSSRLSRLESTVSGFESSIQWNQNNIATLVAQSNKLTYVCRELKYQYRVRKWIPSQTTDGNGFMRISMSGLPNDAVNKSNDCIVSIVPYDFWGTGYERIIVAWNDYNQNGNYDGYINVALRYAYDSQIGKVGSGQRIAIWYWARNSVENYDL